MAEIAGREEAVCASVTLKLSQTTAMTREAFDGTLTLYNGNGSTPITALKMDVSVLDDDGNERKDLFEIFANGTTGDMGEGSVLEGGLSVSPGGTGSAKVRFVPERQAAPTVPKRYRFGGTVTYVDPFSGEQATVKLTPVALTVDPSPYLKLDYFVQRDVYADDPFTTDAVEASMPAELAVLIVNTGAGEAKNVTISSVQPEIVKNENGLDVAFSMKDFSLDATALNGSTAHLGLNVVSLGTIPAGESQVAQWWLTSTLEGHFTKMSASVTPVNSRNTPDTALVNPDVGMHRLIRSLAVAGEQKPHFLTSENYDLYGTPDTVFHPDGNCETVRGDAETSVGEAPVGASPSLTLSVSAQDAGWHYVSAAIPGLFRYEVASVVRSDGVEIPVRNAWITDRTFRDGSVPKTEERLHLADDLPAAGAFAYTISLAAKPADIPEIVSFGTLADGGVESVVRDEVTVVFSKAVDLATFSADDLILKSQGVTIADLSGVVLAYADESRKSVRISGLSAFCKTYGRYELTVQCAGIADLGGQLGAAGKSVSWMHSNPNVPHVVTAEGVPGRPVRSLDSIVVITSVAVTPESFAAARLSLDGVDVSGDLVVRALDESSTRFEIGGLDALQADDGEHVLVISCADLRSVAGTAGAGTFERSWVRDTVAPSLLDVSRDSGLGGNVISVSFSEAIDADAFSLANVRLTRDGRPCALPVSTRLTVLDAGTCLVDGFDTATVADGVYEFTVDATGVADEAGNSATGSRSVSWTVDTTPPAQTGGLAVSSAYGSVDTVVCTGERNLTVSGTVGEPGVTVQVLCRYAGGSETLLDAPSVAADGSFATTLALPENGGGFSLIVRQTDAAGNSSDREIRVYYDKIALTAELSGAPAEDVVADAVTLSFSDAVVADDVSPDRFALTRDGEAVALEGVTLTAGADGRSFVLAGLARLCATDGAYALSFDPSGVRKGSSGLKASACAPLAWSYLCPDREPPTVVSVLIDGEEARGVYTNGILSVSVTFSEAVNLSSLVADGLVGQALKVQLLDADNNVTGLVRAAASEVTCTAAEIGWTLPADAIGRGAARLVVDAGLVADLAGNRLAATGFAVADGLRTFAFGSDAVANVASYAMPTWHDCDGDGLGDLVVGEKTTGGQGKVRVYRNVGTAAEPVFADFTYLQVNGSDLELAASGCQGAQVSFADVTGDGHDDLIVGRADGKVQLWPGTATDGAYGPVVELRSGSEATYGSARAYVCPYDLDGDGAAELVVGGLDGRFRMLKYASSGSSESWLTDPDGAPLKVTAGRSSPVLADVNGDGCVDILSGDTDGNVRVFLGEGAAWNATPVALYAKTGTVADRSRLGFGDVNGDGAGDLLVGRSDGSVRLALGTGTGSPSVAFEVTGPDEIAPTVVDIRFDGGEPAAEYVRMFTNVTVVFSEKVDLEPLIRKGTVGQALYIELLDGNTNVYRVVRAKDAVWDEARRAVTWTVDETEIPCAFARVVVNASFVRDMAGNALAPVDAYGTIRSAKVYAPSVLMARAAAAFAAPALRDWDGDGLLDLLVGELAPSGTGKVRIYLNRGSATHPAFEDFAYLGSDDAELELPGGTDLGVHVSFAGSRGRTLTFVCGDGSVYTWRYDFVDRTTGVRAEPVKSEWTVIDRPDFATVAADVNGDLETDLVTGDASGNVVVCLGLGDGTFDDEKQVLYANSGERGTARIAVGDLTGDGLDDIVVGRPDGSVLLLTASYLQSQAVGFERVRVIPIDEALTLDAYWKIGDGWVCEQVGHDAQAVCAVADGGCGAVTSRFENAGTVTFGWGCAGGNSGSVYACSVDGTEKLTQKGPFGVRTDGVRLEGAGSHEVEWRLVGGNRAVLRDVSFVPDNANAQVAADGKTTFADLRAFARGIWTRSGGDYAQVLNATAANGRPVAENCIAGLDCDDPEAKFVGKIEIVNGEPVVTWEPALNGEGIREGVRRYGVQGSCDLKTWTAVPKGQEGGYPFFKVTVERP